MTISDAEMLDLKFARIAASLTCPILRTNYEKLSRSEYYKQYAEIVFLPNFVEKFQKLVSDERILSSIILDCYSHTSEDLQDTFKIAPKQYAELIEFLEILAVGYIALSTQGSIRESIGQVLDLTSQLVEKLNEATLGWSENLDQYETLFLTISSDDEKSKHYSEVIQSLVEAKDKLQSLPDFIKNSQSAKMVEYGKRAQPSNSGLQIWVENVYLIWVGILGRTIENKNDGLNGRKHLLNFMEALMLPVHEALEFSTLDNMLRKVQEDVKARGGFNHPNFVVGASSPLGVGWSNSES